jgi:hypothetical protein
MTRGPLYQETYKPQFSGHETFPLRHGWLKKIFDAIAERDGDPDNKTIFTRDDAIARFGVGKNMVTSMRHWSIAAGIITPNGIQTTPLGRFIFGDGGVDPYLEHPATLWLIHWHLSGRPDKTTWFWIFSHYAGNTFERETLCRGLQKLANDRDWNRASAITIKRDVECLVRTYAAKSWTERNGYEEDLESPLAELGMIKATGKRDGFRLVNGNKPSLRPGAFLYSLCDFWQNFSKSSTLSFESIAYEPGSLGKVFLLDETDLSERLQDIEDVSNGAYKWSETAGLKQVIRNREIREAELFDLIRSDYTPRH